MLNWRMVWSSFSSRVCPPIYRRWRFSHLRAFTWAGLCSNTALEPELLLLPEFLGLPGFFLDVGANNGDYLWKALQCKKAAQVAAVEPIPFLAGILKRAFPGVRVHNMALSDAEGPRALKIPDIKGRTYNTRATLNVDHKEEGETGEKIIQVATSSLDMLWKSQGDPPLACIKIDTEGHELIVLKGSTETLKKHRPLLLVEIEQRHHKEDIKVVFDFLGALGYRGYYFDPSVPGLKALCPELKAARGATPDNPNARYLNNFFFLHEARSDLFETLSSVNRRLAETARAA